jgi:hypothetical protein
VLNGQVCCNGSNVTRRCQDVAQDGVKVVHLCDEYVNCGGDAWFAGRHLFNVVGGEGKRFGHELEFV